jgi:hypothetical protein
MMDVIRILTNFVNRRAHKLKASVLTYRGSKMTSAEAARLLPDFVIRPPMFVATSTCAMTAQMFATNACYIVEFVVPVDSFNAKFVERVSNYQAERELLLPPYTPLRILSHSVAEKRVRVQVLDGSDHYKCELASGHHAPAYAI